MLSYSVFHDKVYIKREDTTQLPAIHVPYATTGTLLIVLSCLLLQRILILFGLLSVVFGQQSPYLSYDPEAIRQGFIASDHNHDGNLTLHEVLAIFKKNDFNGDGFMSYREFKVGQPRSTPKNVVEGQFNYYDILDGEFDGRISLSVALRMINVLDVNKDGVVTLNEYLQALPHVLDDMTKEIDAIALVG